MKKLFLIDGSGYLYRAYFWLPEMLDDQGMQVQVVYWFVKMMLRLVAQKPDNIIIARDSPKKTKRHDIFPSYKANRPKAPQEFSRQIPITQALIQDLWIASNVIPGYEADDIIYTYANHAKQLGYHTTVFSSDKDLKQILHQDLVFKDPMKQHMTTVASFMQEFWFEPQYIVDYLALVGDASDNIPWVAGIWQKWADKLIRTYNTIENIYQHIDAITWKTKEKLLAWRESAFESKGLIKLLNVEDIAVASLEQTSCSFSYVTAKTLLIDTRKFASLDKILEDLKGIYAMPVQTSLFW